MVDLAKDSLLSASPQTWDKTHEQCLGLGLARHSSWHLEQVIHLLLDVPEPPRSSPLAGPPEPHGSPAHLG